MSSATMEGSGVLHELTNTLLLEKAEYLTEKDRLLHEKQELVSSHAKLWETMQEIIQDQDAKIAELRAQLLAANNSLVSTEEHARLLERNQQLEDALNDLLEAEALPSLDHGGEEAHGILFNEIAKFLFAPLILNLEDDDYHLGNMDDLAWPVKSSIRTMVTELEKRHNDGRLEMPVPAPHRIKLKGCMWAFIVKSAGSTRWTTQKPQQFACASCFNASRAGLAWIGDMTWVVLPLPSGIRNPNATAKDAEYYIQQGVRTARAKYHPGMWSIPQQQQQEEHCQ